MVKVAQLLSGSTRTGAQIAPSKTGLFTTSNPYRVGFYGACGLFQPEASRSSQVPTAGDWGLSHLEPAWGH